MKKTETDPNAFFLQKTPFGPVALLWAAGESWPVISRILLSGPNLSAEDALKRWYPNAAACACPEIEAIGCEIESFLSGEAAGFSIALVRLDLCTPFQQNVLRAEHAIPRGSVSTYRLIANHLGKPRAARAVGTALATNPFPIIIPCHRAIRSDGSLGGYQGGLAMKKHLLEMEGIEFLATGRVAKQYLFYT